MSDQIVINVTQDPSIYISAIDSREEIVLNPLQFSQAVNHALTHSFGGSDELFHNKLRLQGGIDGEYYHLTSGQYANLVYSTGTNESISATWAYINNFYSDYIETFDFNIYPQIEGQDDSKINFFNSSGGKTELINSSTGSQQVQVYLPEQNGKLALLNQTKWNVPALRVNDYYTTEGFINLYQITTGELFQGWGDLHLSTNPNYPIWQSSYPDQTQCVLYTDTYGQKILRSANLNQGNPITGTPTGQDIPVWKMLWSGTPNISYNKVDIDLIDKYQVNYNSDTPPENAKDGDYWFNKVNGKRFTYYVNSGQVSGQWIQVS